MNIEDALCAQTGGEAFFPESGNAVPHDALAICAVCPVIEDCLDLALRISRDEDYGVWGGTTPPDRRRIRKNPALRAHYMERLYKTYHPDNKKGKVA